MFSLSVDASDLAPERYAILRHLQMRPNKDPSRPPPISNSRNEEWDAWSEHIRMQFHQPGTQWWWKLRRTAFAKSFRDYLDECSQPEMMTMSEILQDRVNDTHD